MHPILFHAGALLVPTYGAVMAVGLVLSLLLAQHCARRQGLAPAEVWNASIIALFCGAVCAKLWMVCTHLAAFRAAPALVLNLSAIGGGVQGRVAATVAIVVFLAYTARTGARVRSALDAIAAPVLLLLAFEGVACWFSGCAFGTPASHGITSTFHSAYAFVWWGTPVGTALHAVQVESAVVYACFAAMALWAGTWGLRSGRVAAGAMVAGGFAEFFLQFWRGDVRSLAWIPALTATQSVCLALMLAGATLLYTPRAWRAEPQP